MAAPRILPYDFDVVTRRVNRSCSSLEPVLDAVGSYSEHLRIDRPFAAGSGTIPVWHATGRLYGSGLRVARYTRVDVEIMAWSERAAELRMRPVSRRVALWGRRRQRRYFALAHRTIDELTRVLDAAAARSEATVLVGTLGRASSARTAADAPTRDRRTGTGSSLLGTGAVR